MILFMQQQQKSFGCAKLRKFMTKKCIAFFSVILHKSSVRVDRKITCQKFWCYIWLHTKKRFIHPSSLKPGKSQIFFCFWKSNLTNSRYQIQHRNVARLLIGPQKLNGFNRFVLVDFLLLVMTVVSPTI